MDLFFMSITLFIFYYEADYCNRLFLNMSSVLDFVIFYRSFLFLAWAFYCALMMLFCFFICQMKVDILGSVSVGSMFCFVGGFCASMLVLRQLSTALSLKMSSTVTDFAIEELIGLASFVDMAPPVPMANGIYMASFFGILRVLISFDNLWELSTDLLMTVCFCYDTKLGDFAVGILLGRQNYGTYIMHYSSFSITLAGESSCFTSPTPVFSNSELLSSPNAPFS